MTSTFVAGLRHDGIAAPMLLDTPMTGRTLQHWLTTSSPSCPLRSHSNDAAHRRNLVGRLRPIEQVFAKLKALLRRAAPRSFDAIVTALRHILERFRPAECANYLRHSGYVQT